MTNVPPDLKKLSRLLDSSFEGPGGFKFGWDAIIGLIPGIGDFLTSTLSVYIIARAAALGAPPILLMRMGMNVIVENLIGLIPLIGDIFDFVWKSNLKNIDLLESYLVKPTSTARRSAALVWGTVILFVTVILGSLALSFYLLLRLVDSAL